MVRCNSVRGCLINNSINVIEKLRNNKTALAIDVTVCEENTTILAPRYPYFPASLIVLRSVQYGTIIHGGGDSKTSR
jgi:hypothetical protein